MATKAQLAAAQQDIAAQRARRATSASPKAKQISDDVKDNGIAKDDVKDDVLFEVSDSRRMLVGTVLGLIGGVASFSAVSTVTSWLIATAWVAGTGAFLSTMIYVLGIILAVYAGLKTASSVFGYVISEQDKQHLTLVKSAWTNSKERIVSMWNREDDAVTVH